MRFIALLLCLCALAARAQQPDAPTPPETGHLTPPPAPSTDAPPPEALRPWPADATGPAPEAPRPAEPAPVFTGPAAPAPEAARPSEPAPDAPRPAAPAPEAPRPAEPAPETLRPAAPAPEAARPSEPAPESFRPSAPAPETFRPAEPAPAYTGPAEPAATRALRYSRASAGPGGALLAFTEVLGGLVTGGMLGYGYDGGSGAYTGAVVAGLTLGTAAIVYQYFVPVERRESLLIAGGSVVGFIAGVGMGNELGLSLRERGWLTLALTQVGILGTLLATAGDGDVSGADTALVGMTSLYALVLTGLAQSVLAGNAEDYNLTPTFLAPALGFVVGSVLTRSLELDTGRVLKLTLVPLGVGLVLRYLGTAFADGPGVKLTALAGIAASFALTALLTSDPGVPTERDSRQRAGVQAVPVPVVMTAGRYQESLAAGPGLLLSF
jgi:hypothetical protein